MHRGRTHDGQLENTARVQRFCWVGGQSVYIGFASITNSHQLPVTLATIGVAD